MSNLKAETESDGLIDSVLLLPPSIDRAPYEAALGKLTMRFSALHFMLEAFGWKLWQLGPSTGMVLTKDLQTKHLVEKLRQSADRAIPNAADLRDFKSILKKVEKVAEKRNELLHSLWSFNGESATRSNRKDFTVTVITSIDEINKLNRDILDTMDELYKFEEREPLKSPLGMALKEDTKRKKTKDG